MKHSLFALALTATFNLLAGSSSFAATDTWNGGPGSWASGANWSSNPTAPGAVGTTTNADIALFTNATGGTVTVDANRNVKNITFDTGAGAYTLSGGPLALTSGGAITLGVTGTSFTGTGITETISAPIILENTAFATYSFTNNSTTASDVLNISGPISNGTVNSGVTLALIGANTGANTVSGSIGNGGNLVNLTTAGGTGNWILSATNTFGGTTAVSGGTLQLNNANAVQDSVVTISLANGLKFGTGIGTFNLAGLSGTSNEALTDIGGTNGVTLQLGLYNNAAGSYSGILSGSGGITKFGTGTQTLSGNNTYTGTTTVTGLPTDTIASTLATTTGTPFGVGNVVMNGGNLSITGTGVAALTGVSNAAGSTFTYAGGDTLFLKKGTGGGLSYTIGNASPSGSVLVRSGNGVLIVQTNSNDLGTSAATGEDFFVTGTAPATNATNKMVSASIVTLGGGTASLGDFLTYGANGFASDSTNYTNTTGAIGSALPTTQIENVTAATSFTTNNQVYALLVQNTFTATINSGVTLTIAGDGTTDGVILNGGKIVGASATSALNFGATEGIIYDFNAAATLSVPITGSGGVTFAGNKAFSFGNPTGATSNGSTYTGGANLEGISFTLKTSNDTTGTNDDLTIFGAPTNTITLNGATLTGNLAEEAGRTVVLGPSGASISASGSLAFNMSGSGALTLTGGSSISYIALDGNSSYSGGTYLNGAMAIIASEKNIGGSSAPITFFGNNSGLSIVGTSLTSLSNPLSFVANAGGAVAFDIQSPDNAATGNYFFTLGQALNFGTTGFQKYGLGTLVLTGAETYSGTTFLSGGVLEVNEAAGGSLSSVTPLSFNGGTLYILGAAAGTTTQTVGNVTLGQAVSGAPTNGGAIVVDSNLSNGGTGTTLKLGTLPGGSGTDTTIPGGALQLKVIDSSASITTTTAPDGTGIYGGRIVFTDASGNTNWATSSSSGPTYTISGYNSYTTYNGATDGQVNVGNGRLTGSLTSTGSTTFNTLKIANTSTGTYDLAGGTLTLTAGGLLYTGTADYTISSSVAGGTIVSGLTTGTTNTYNLTSAYTGATSDLVVQDYGTARLTISAVITNGAVSEFSNLTKAGPGTLILSGANTYTGATFVDGGILQIASDSNIGGNNGTINVTSSLTTSPTVTLASSTLPAGFGVGSKFLGRVVLSISGTTVTLNGNASIAIASSSAVSWATEQYLVLNGGTLQVTSNVTFTQSNSSGLAATGTLQRPVELGSAGGTINMLNGSTLTMVGGSAISSFTGNFAGPGPSALTIDANDGLGGTVVLGGSLDEAIGGIIINGGTLQTNVTASLNQGALNTITFGSGTENSIATHPTLALAAGTSNFIAGLDSPSGSSALVKNVSGAAILNIVNAGTDTYTGLLNNGATGSLALTKGGAGIQNLTNTGNTYTGTTSIDDGTLNVASLANGGSNSSIGASTNAAANLVFGGGPVGSAVLQYTGSTAISTDRLFTLGDVNPDAFVMGNNGAIDASGSNSGATVSFTSSGSIAFANPAFIHNLTLTGTNTGANTFAPVLGDSTLPTSLSKTGTGTWVLTGVNTYTGATTVSAGTLALGTGGSLGNTAVAVNTTGTLQINGNRTIGTSGVASVAVNSGGTLSLVDGAINTLTLNTTSGNSLVMGGGGTLAFDLGATSDQILLSTGTASVTGNTTVNITSLGSLSGTTQTLISAAGGGLGTTGFTLGTITGSTGIYTLSLNETNNNLFLNENAGGAATAAFWSGANGSAWNTTSPTTNFNTDLGSGTPTSAVPSSVTNVTFTATGASNFAATTLGQDFTINSLTFNTTGVGIGGANTLTLLAGNANGNTLGNGITSSGSGTNTISSAVALGSSQTWTANSGNTLAVSGQVSDGGNAFSLSTAGSGKISLTNSSGNTYTGGTTVGGTSTLFIGNTSGSATGSGALAVLRGAALAGTGTSSGSSFAIGASGSGTASIYVGQAGATGDTNTTSNLTLKGGSGLNNSTIANANLTFNLDTTSAGGLPGAGNELLVGNTGIAFGSAVTLTLNLQGGQNVTSVPYFVLIAGTAGTSGPGQLGSQYTGLSLGSSFSADGGTLTPILNSSVGGSGNLALALNLNGSTAFYGGQAGLYLFQTAGGIDDIVVIPEPSTWAMMLGGLAVLIFLQRRKRI